MSIFRQMPGKCFLCGRTAETDTHHVFGGCRRQTSDKWDVTVELCRECHEAIHNHPAKDQFLKKYCQEYTMKYYQWTLHKWMQEFGKSYL